MRVAIQNKIMEVCKAGTFAKITYDGTTKQSTKSTTEFLEPSVIVNEISGSPSQAVVHGARTGQYGMSSWTFEARLKFTSEVDLYYFLTNQLKSVSITHENTRAVIRSAGVPVEHSPRQGSHNGTQLIITFSVETRR